MCQRLFSTKVEEGSWPTDKGLFIAPHWCNQDTIEHHFGRVREHAGDSVNVYTWNCFDSNKKSFCMRMFKDRKSNIYGAGVKMRKDFEWIKFQSKASKRQSVQRKEDEKRRKMIFSQEIEEDEVQHDI